MTVTKEDPEITVNATPEQPLATAVGVATGVEKPTGGAGSEPPIPAGHSRFYCSKCRSVSLIFCYSRDSFICVYLLLTLDSICKKPYDLPSGANSWRCANCHTFNSTQPGECEWCTIM